MYADAWELYAAKVQGDKYRFGNFELDVAGQLLRRAGEAVHVEPRALDLLCHLVVHQDRVVPKNELLDEVWGIASSARRRSPRRCGPRAWPSVTPAAGRT